MDCAANRWLNNLAHFSAKGLAISTCARRRTTYDRCCLFKTLSNPPGAKHMDMCFSSSSALQPRFYVRASLDQSGCLWYNLIIILLLFSNVINFLMFQIKWTEKYVILVTYFEKNLGYHF